MQQIWKRLCDEYEVLDMLEEVLVTRSVKFNFLFDPVYFSQNIEI